MSLTAPIKPTPPTVPAVKLQPVESSSQNTLQSAPPQKQKTPENTAEKPKINENTEIPANNATIINKVEPNDQNKIPLLNSAASTENAHNTNTAADAPQAPPNKSSASNLDIYAAAICIALVIGVAIYFFSRQKVLPKQSHKQQHKRPKPKENSAEQRTIVDYSADNTKEIIDLITSPHDISPEAAKIKDKITTKKELKNNFEFRI